MQKLHLVGLTTDRRGLIFSSRRGTKTGSFVVNVDRSLVDALAELGAEEGAATQGGEELGRETSSLSVRDVQALLRRGQTIEQVAKTAGVSPQWVGRFAAPVLAERTAVLDELHDVVYEAPRKGPSAAPLGDSIRWHLRDKGVPDVATAFAEGWAARQLDGDDWAVTLRYRNRQRRHEARWHFNRRSHEVSAQNRLAAELAYVPPPGAPTGRPAPARSTRAPRKAPTAKPKPAKEAPKKRPATGAKQTSAKRSRTKQNRAKQSKTVAVKAKPAKASRARAAAGPAGRAAARRAVRKAAPKSSKATKTSKGAKVTKGAKGSKAAKPAKASNPRKGGTRQRAAGASKATGAKATSAAKATSGAKATSAAKASKAGKASRARTASTSTTRSGPPPARSGARPARGGGAAPVPPAREPVDQREVRAPLVEPEAVVHAPPGEPELPPFLAGFEAEHVPALARAAWPPEAHEPVPQLERAAPSPRRRAPLRAERNGQGEPPDRS